MAATAFDNKSELFAAPLQTPQWSPYVNNGGTAAAIAGQKFAIVAADTRISEGYSIHTRTQTKVIKLTDKCVLASAGMLADIKALQKVLKYRLETYFHQHQKYPSTPAIAQLLSNTLYSRRFFPYYSFNVLGGIDDNGKGVCYSYDAVGSFELAKYTTSGTGTQLIQPVFDNQLGWKQRKPGALGENYSLDDALELMKDAFTSAGERDIYTGDSVDICVVTEEGIRSLKFDLKQD